MVRSHRPAFFVASLALAGCAGATPAPEAPSPAERADPAAQQVEDGGRVYAARCAGCHGAEGQGTGRGPALVGPGALPLDPPAAESARQVRFATAADVLSWVRANMPPSGGSLTDAEYEAVVAFALAANGVDLGGRRVTAETAAAWVLHP